MMTKTQLQQILLSLLITIGACGVCLFAGGAIIDSLPLTRTDSVSAESVCLALDSTPLIMSQEDETGAYDYRDLEGNPVPPPEETQPLRKAYLPRHWEAANLGGLRRLFDGLAPATYWYMQEDSSLDAARGYLVGYDSKSKRLIGYLGRSGFSASPPAPSEMFHGIRNDQDGSLVYLGAQLNGDMQVPVFAGPGASMLEDHAKIFIPTDDGKILSVNLQKRSITTIYDSAPLVSAAGYRNYAEKHAQGLIAVRTLEAVLLIDSSGEERHRFAIPESLKGESFGLTITKDQGAVLDWAGPEDSLVPTRLLRLFHIGHAGDLSETSIELASVASRRPTQVYGGYVYPSPLPLMGMIRLGRAGELITQGLEHDKLTATMRAIGEFRFALLTAAAISFVFVLFCIHRCASYGASVGETMVWAVFVFAFGLPGWIGFRYGRNWPVLEKCRTCGKQTPGDRDQCAGCEEDLWAPVETGTEVFA